jgi:ubiquitin carboxyl-terminal hydrolase 8
MEKDIDKKLFFANKGLNGLMNRGNTCYINTSIQCLGHCISFLIFILSGKYERNEGHIANELREILCELWINDNGVIPNRFLKYLEVHLKSLHIQEQNDIQEFLLLFLDKLNASISIKLDVDDIVNKLQYKNNITGKLKKKLDVAWYKSVSNEYSHLVDIFYGQKISQIICGNCKKLHHNYELFSMLCVPMNEDKNDVNTCIKSYCKSEYLNEDKKSNDWKCDNCNQCSKSLKTMKLSRLPKILIISLKRFTDDMRKNYSHIDIPETLDMKEYLLNKNHVISEYQLCSIACHMGSFTNGHYYALCKNPNNKWYIIDDTNVSDIDEIRQYGNSAYMLFYEMKKE